MEASSSAVVILFPKGMLETIVWSFCSGFGKVPSHSRYMSVITSAGTTALTRMLYGKSSTAHSRVNARIAPLADA